MAVDPRQIKIRKILDQLASGVSGVELDDLLESADNELQMPLRLRATGTHEVTIDNLVVNNPIVDNDGVAASSGAGNDRNRVMAPLNNVIPFAFTGATITIPSTNNNNITQTTSGGSFLLNILNDGDYVRIGFFLDRNGNIIMTSGSQNATLNSASIPKPSGTVLAIGHVVLQRSGTSIASIGGSSIYQYAGSGGSGSLFSEEQALVNGQSTETDITNFLIDSADNKGFDADILINRSYNGAVTGVEDVDAYSHINLVASGAFNNLINDALVQPDGKILAGGSFTSLNGNTRNYLIRLNSDGTEDTTFYTNLTSTGTGAGFGGIAIFSTGIQSDGKILVCGPFTSLNGNTRNRLVRLNSDGTEDTTFYTNLTSTGTGAGFDNAVYNIATQSDGKILVSGAFTSFNGSTRNRLVRLNSDGTEDTTFYTNLTSTGTGAGFSGVARVMPPQSDGKILVSGAFTSFNGSTRNRLVRLNSDGTEDTTFYTNLGTGFDNQTLYALSLRDGKILIGGQFTTMNSVSRAYIAALNYDGSANTTVNTELGSVFTNIVSRISYQSDNKILIAGSTSTASVAQIARLNADYTLDTTFNSTIATAGFDSSVSEAIWTDLGIIAAGGFTSFNGNTRNRLVRLNSDGTEDTEFYTQLSSTVATGVGFVNSISDLGKLSDNSVIAAGSITQIADTSINRIVKLNPNYTENTTFTTNVGTGANSAVLAAAVQTNDQIVIGGNFTTFSSTTAGGLTRLSSDGTLDTTFNSNVSNIAAAVPGYNGTVFSIQIQTNSQIVAAGSYTTLNDASIQYLSRLNSDGTLDSTFSTNLGVINNTVSALALQSDGKILIGGSFTTVNGNTRTRLARINSDGTDDTAFGANMITGFNGTVYHIALQSDGKIIVCGAFTSFNGQVRNGIVRLNTDGTEDIEFANITAPGFNNTVYYVSVADNDKIYVSGIFTTFKGNTRKFLLRLNPDGSEDTDFYTSLTSTGDNSGFSGAVEVVLEDGNSLVVGGGYASLNGLTRGSIAFLSATDNEYIKQYTLRGFYSPTTGWNIGESSYIGSDPGVTLTMTNAGQLQYTSTLLDGAEVSSFIRYIIKGL